MEVIGAVSSVVALVETTSKLAKSLTHLAQRWQNAPEEILALAQATKDLAAKFAFVGNIVTNSPTTLVDDIAREGLLQLVVKAKAAINELDILQKKLDTYQSILQRAKWAVKDARTVKSVLSTIKDIEEGLSMWINFVSLKGHSLTLLQAEETQRILSVGFAEMRQMFSGLTVIHPSNPLLTATSRKGSSSIVPSSSTKTSDPTARAASQTTIIRKFEAITWESSKVLQSWGIRGAVVKSSTKGESTDYDFGFNAHLPLAWLFGSYALRGQLSIRKSSPVSNTFTLRHPSYFTVARVLDESHPFFKACSCNDVVTVRSMLRSGEGRPTDVNHRGKTCFWYAIVYGSMDVAICLLDNGAAVDEAVTSEQQTPLQFAAILGEIDILRMLLDRGASLDRFDENGMDASVGCILTRRGKKVAPVDMLKVISGHISIDTNAIDLLDGTTLLHLTASYQSASEIDLLISLGSSVEVRDRGGRNALYFAAFGGNPATYFALLAHGSTTEDLADNLLYVIDAKANSFNSVYYDEWDGLGLFDPILRDLLDRRTDLMTSVCIVNGEVEDIQGPAIPLQQAAAAYGPGIEAWFLGLLQECGRETEEDRRRLQELRTGGYDQHGTVIGEVDEESDYDSTDGDSENASSESDRSSARSEADDTEEEYEFFWDAEEGA